MTEAKIVISSTWRRCYDLKLLKTLLWRTGLSSNHILDVIPLINETDSIRGDAIDNWLRNTNHTIANYAIIDDDSDMLDEQKDNFVKINGQAGITRANCQKVIEILK